MNTTQLAARLFQLQQLDLELDRLNSEQQSIITSLQEGPKLRKLRAEYVALQQQWQANTQARKEAEWSLEDVNNRLKQQEQRLYQGTVGNAKELQAIQQEIQHLKAQQSREEDRTLQVIDSEESSQDLVERKQIALQEAEEAWQNETVVLAARRDQIEKRRQELEQQRSTIASSVDESQLKRYNTLKRTKQGRAVSKIEQNSCQWCLVILTPSELQRARIGPELQTCSNCGRILYYER